MFDKEKRKAIQRTIDEQQQFYEKIIENIKSEFEEKFQQQLNAVETEVFTEISTVFDDPQVDETNIAWKEKYNEAVMKSVKLVTKEFLDDLNQQKEELTAHFQGIVK